MDLLKNFNAPQQGAEMKEIIEYLNKLHEALSVQINNIGIDNLNSQLKSKIEGGDNN